VFSWNTLADSLCESGGFQEVDPNCLKWSFRSKYLTEVIRENNPDIICLYDVDHFNDYFKPELEKYGYKGIFQMKFYTAPNEPNDGTAVFWNSEKFTLSGHEVLQYNKETQFAHFCKFEENSQQQQQQQQQQHQQQQQQSGCGIPSLCVVTTHLKAKEGFEERRKAQGKALLEHLETFNSQKLPTIICGDFNDTPESLVCKEILSKKFSTVYSEKNLPGKSSIWSTWKKREVEVKRTIDHIFYDPEKLNLMEILEIPSEKDCPNRFPGNYYPSDHIAIAAKFHLSKY